MRTVANGMVFSVILFLSGCGAPNDPVENLKWHFSKAVKTFNEAQPQIFMIPPNYNIAILDRGKWESVYQEIDPSNIKYDVEKTISLTTPYIAQITFKQRGFGSSVFETETEAKSAIFKKNEGGEAIEHYAKYEYEDGKWKLKSIEYQAGWNNQFLRRLPEEKDVFNLQLFNVMSFQD
jgi:hypothetical protein